MEHEKLVSFTGCVYDCSFDVLSYWLYEENRDFSSETYGADGVYRIIKYALYNGIYNSKLCI